MVANRLCVQDKCLRQVADMSCHFSSGRDLLPLVPACRAIKADRHFSACRAVTRDCESRLARLGADLDKINCDLVFAVFSGDPL